MKPLIFFKIFSIVAIIFHANIGFACTCIGDTILKDEYSKRDLIVRGIILEENTVELILSDSLIDVQTYIKSYKVEVKYQYKGTNSEKIITLFSGSGGGDCGFPFKLGKEYIIYIDKVSDIFNGTVNDSAKLNYTDICYRTRVWTEVEDTELKNLRKCD